jgi:16S rRNA C1402 (ribose-2'-O) methylase RsmI
MDHSQADAKPVQAAPKRPTMLRRLLSHHEIATLLLLLHAPVDAHAKPEIPMLQEAGLVETIASDAGAPRIRLTEHGNAILRGLGVR